MIYCMRALHSTRHPADQRDVRLPRSVRRVRRLHRLQRPQLCGCCCGGICREADHWVVVFPKGLGIQQHPMPWAPGEPNLIFQTRSLFNPYLTLKRRRNPPAAPPASEGGERRAGPHKSRVKVRRAPNERLLPYAWGTYRSGRNGLFDVVGGPCPLPEASDQ